MTPPIPSRWPPQHPDRIQLYSLATPNGQKVGIALEEMELPYDGLEHFGHSSYANVNAWVERCASRPATSRGRQVNG